ncbi:MAG: VanZ family protein [Clostridiales bacterium]|nr:VanZ family protein [Clostridiales bacterium]
MYNQKHVVAKRIVFGILALAMMAVIFFMSSQNGDESGGLSDGLTKFVVDTIENVFKVKFENPEEALDTVSLIIRKGGHFSEYFVLSVFVTLFMYTIRLNRVALSGISLAFCSLYAVTDEFHQSFVSDRFASPVDVGIDSSGALLATAIILIIFAIAQKKRDKKEDIQVETYPI